jgi:hypothetical protein
MIVLQVAGVDPHLGLKVARQDGSIVFVKTARAVRHALVVDLAAWCTPPMDMLPAAPRALDDDAIAVWMSLGILRRQDSKPLRPQNNYVLASLIVWHNLPKLCAHFHAPFLY